MQAAIAAVFRSWSSAKAVAYREMRGLSHGMGTAVTVQRMVFDAMRAGCPEPASSYPATPATVIPPCWVDFLFNAQGRGRGQRPAERTGP
ncbi:PEP/pyruvate-binding domain-containing protein [Mesorhizobium atlanticum]